MPGSSARGAEFCTAPGMRMIFFARVLLELGLRGEQRRKPVRKKDREDREQRKRMVPRMPISITCEFFVSSSLDHC